MRALALLARLWGPGKDWRLILLAALVLGSLIVALLVPPFGQDLNYHNFADQRAFLGVPNFYDVVSNLPFLLVGAAGLVLCLGPRLQGGRPPWITFFVGVSLVSFGSAYYHWNPTSQTLVWDRLPMTVAFMGLAAALLGEYVQPRLGAVLLVPLVLLGFSSVAYWHWTDDLRFYIWIQLMALLLIPALMALFRPANTRQGYLLVAFFCYGLAKIAEVGDQTIFTWTQHQLSGHSLKHLLAGLGIYAVLAMLRTRESRA
ncbi:MAG: hypothetical protein GKR89_10990 [Candidatus Latescibacteria bacterium]|nr:hypothetical protein [Candidatus Latescibacterota bacterium]